MKVYRVKIAFCDEFNRPIICTRLYLARCFDDVVAFARSKFNPVLPDTATFPVVESAELIDDVTVAGEFTFSSCHIPDDTKPAEPAEPVEPDCEAWIAWAKTKLAETRACEPGLWK